MVRIASLLRSLGNAGAVANAYRACEERREAELRVDALTRRLAPSVAASARRAAASSAA
jgi:hypothetical protein